MNQSLSGSLPLRHTNLRDAQLDGRRSPKAVLVGSNPSTETNEWPMKLLAWLDRCLRFERGSIPLWVATGQSAGRNTVSKTVEVGFDSSLACGLVQKAALLVRSEKVRVRFSAGPQGRAKNRSTRKSPAGCVGCLTMRACVEGYISGWQSERSGALPDRSTEGGIAQWESSGFASRR